MQTNKQIYSFLFLLTLIVVVFVMIPPFAQPLSYHLFADSRAFFSTPNFLDVWSNLPFFLVGGWAGFKILCEHERIHYQNTTELWSWSIFAVGVMLVGFGSAYYHLSPNNATLLWDRLPMSIAFMALTYALIADHLKLNSPTLLVTLVFLGVGSVLFWYYTEQIGAGDLRPYALVQFFPMSLLPILLITTPSKYTKKTFVIAGFGWYIFAKLLEHFDAEIFNILNGHISGHTLKHFASAIGAYMILRYIFVRQEKV